MKKLMIVGASVLQLPAILKAKEMGLHVAVVDFNPQAIGIPYADEYYNASTMDEDAVLAAAEKYKPDGIMTLATDMPMRGVAKTSDKLHLHSINYETAVKATDKYDMIKAFKEHNVPSPWYFVVDTLEELKAHETDVTFPCIIKPTDNAGSHGVAKVYSFQELIENYDYAHSCSRHGKVIAEEFLDGPEVSVEVMVVNGKVNILQITDKITTEAPHFVEMGHTQPSRLPVPTQDAIRQVATAACLSIGIDKGPAHVEMKVTKRGPVMIELGARMGGDNITTHLVPLSTGIDMVGSTIKVALGEEPDITPTLHCGSAIRYFEVPFGTIKAIENVDAAKQISGVKQITFTQEVGEESTPIQCSNDRIGFVIAQGTTPEDADCKDMKYYTMKDTRDFLESIGMPGGDLYDLPTSEKRFPDGGQYRFEVPGIQGPGPMKALLEALDEFGVKIHRVTQTKGIMFLTDDEIKQMVEYAKKWDVQLILACGPRATTDTSASVKTEEGQRMGYRLRGEEQIARGIEEIKRGARLGVRGFLIYDEGLLWALGEARKKGYIPADCHFKVSVAH